MDKRYSKKGLVIIAPERQGTDKETILKLIEKEKIKYTVTKGGNGPVATRGIPHSFIFDVNGKLIFSGNPHSDDFDRTVKKALRDVGATNEEETESSISGPLFSRRTWTNSEGQTIRAEVLSLEGDKVKFRMPNSKVVLYDLSKLSEEDQKLIKEKADEAE